MAAYSLSHETNYSLHSTPEHYRIVFKQTSCLVEAFTSVELAWGHNSYFAICNLGIV